MSDTATDAGTPGPWTFYLGRGANPRMHICTTAGYQVASTPEVNRYETRLADARLIAAAPDLLRALEYIVNDIPEPGEDAELTAEGYNRACEAIAKALGRK